MSKKGINSFTNQRIDIPGIDGGGDMSIQPSQVSINFRKKTIIVIPGGSHKEALDNLARIAELGMLEDGVSSVKIKESGDIVLLTVEVQG